MSIQDSVLDFRSDTLTKPTEGMRQAMRNAEVGDDVFSEDPTVNQLEKKIAELFRREASLLVPSGTMANLIGLALHCQRGDEVIMERRTHSFSYETGGGSALLGIFFNVLDNADGILEPQQVEAVIRPENVHQPISRLLVVENTVNRAGGLIIGIEQMKALRNMCLDNKLSFHMDGARIWHTSVATKTPLSAYAEQVDTLSCCLSKGLGCPIGSMVIGDSATIKKARWLRKMLGGGMRQAGVIAACGLYALKHHIERLEDDHQTARELAYGLRKVMSESYRIQEPQSNILLVHTNSKATTATTIQEWSKVGILALAISDTCIRLVTHLDLPPGSVKEAVNRITR